MKILLSGACGRMGKNLTDLAAERGTEIVCGVDISPSPMPYPVYRDFGSVAEEADVAVDFSSRDCLAPLLAYCIPRRLPAVLCATGYTREDEETIGKASEKIPVFKTGNLSIGVNLLQILAKKAAQILGEDFDAEIVERHHNQKKDAPSGTALMLAESVKEGFGADKNYIFGRKGLVGARGKSEIGIHAVRGGNIVGEHEVMFAGEDEIVTISHSARSRKVFASGALRAAEWLIGRSAGLYGMNDLLGNI